jgi:dihydrofolate synthase / folylpolyglutamate synthase
MIGAHQISNAACAVAAVRRLCEQGWDIEEEAIRRGLAAGSCPARVEFLPGEPSVVIDVAHNPASIAALLDVIRERFGDLPKVLVFASSRDKDYAAMLKLVVGEFDTLILTQYKHNPRAADEQDLARIAAHEAQRQNLPRLPRIETAAEPAEAWRAAVSAAAQNGLVCITGSFFLAAELRSVVTARKVEQATKAQPGPPGPLSSGES